MRTVLVTSYCTAATEQEIASYLAGLRADMKRLDLYGAIVGTPEAPP